MMPADSSPTNVPRCRHCDAVLLPEARQCWLCGAQLDVGGGVSRAAQVTPPAVRGSKAPAASFSLASLMMFMTLLCVIFGVSSLWPGVGIPLGVIVLVVWIRTSAVARRRLDRGLSVSRPERTQLFLASFGATVGFIAMTCLAGCAMFFAACFACVGTWVGLEGPLGEDAATFFAWIVFGVVALAIAVPTLWWLAKAIRRRWRRDIGEVVPVDHTQRRLWFFVLFIILAFLVGWLLFATFGGW